MIKMSVTVPNILTLSRLVLIPVFLLLYHSGATNLALAVLIYSVATDYLDGYLARRLNQESALGALLDPVCDKFLALSFTTYLFVFALIPWWLGIIYFIRNFSQLMAVPILSWWLRRDFKVIPKWQPKWAVTISYVLFPLFFFPDYAGLTIISIWLKYLLIPVSVGLEIYVLVTYLPRLIQIATGQHDTFE